MKRKNLSLIAGGSVIGAVNGLLGGGGGMVAVPLLQRAAALDAQRAHATAIAVILPACIVSGAVYLVRGFAPPAILLPAALGATAGGFFGAKLLKRVPVRLLDIAFAIFMLAAGVRAAL